ncbi:retrovirus-related pol polyprotein from transposon TNT 1-94 [Tanacetum coccineum]
MTALAEHIIVARAENRPPMLEKSMYDSWASRIYLFIKGKKHGRMMLDLIANAQQLQDDCDVQATNIILYGLPPDVYALVNHQEAAKDIWDRVKMLMKGTELSYQELNEVITIQQVKSIPILMHALPSEMDKISLDFIANSPTLYNPSQSPKTSVSGNVSTSSANHTSLCSTRSSSTPSYSSQSTTTFSFPPPFISPSITQQSQAEFLQLDSASRFPPSNNQLRTSSDSKNQATIQDGIATTSKGNVLVGPPRVVKCYNCQGEGHMARQCTQPKRTRNAAWFKEKLMLAEAQEAAFQTDNLDAYDSDCDDLSSAKAVLMASLRVKITPKKIMHLKETTLKSVETPKSEIKVYSRRPKQIKSVGSSKKAKIVESKIANNSKPTHLWGSNATDVSSSSSLVNDRLSRLFSVRFGNDHIARIIGYGDYQLGNVTISRVYYVEGLGHNLFSVGQFCDADLEAEAINTACYTQNRSLIRLRYNKTPYELMQDKKPDLLFFHVFGALCYPTNDNDELGKLDAKDDIGIFVGYAAAKKAFRIYNKRTRKIIETIHVTFNELTAMASKQFSSGPGLHSMTPATSSSRLVPNPVS